MKFLKSSMRFDFARGLLQQQRCPRYSPLSVIWVQQGRNLRSPQPELSIDQRIGPLPANKAEKPFLLAGENAVSATGCWLAPQAWQRIGIVELSAEVERLFCFISALCHLAACVSSLRLNSALRRIAHELVQA